MIVLLLIFQIGIFFFAWFSAREEERFTYPFREFIWPDHYEKAKIPINKQAHRAGATGVLFVLIMAGVGMFAVHPGAAKFNFDPVLNKIIAGTSTALACGIVYSGVFDIKYSREIGQGSFYLGNTAGTDSFWINLFGEKGGLLKALFCVIATILINILFIIFKF